MTNPYNNQSSFGQTTAFWDGYYTGATGDDWRGNGQHPNDAGSETAEQYASGLTAGEAKNKFVNGNQSK